MQSKKADNKPSEQHWGLAEQPEESEKVNWASEEPGGFNHSGGKAAQ